MVASIGKGTVAQYYLKRSEYYMGGTEPAGVWLSSSSALGITAGRTVDAELFEKLHEGLSAAGKPLLSNDGDKTHRVSGYDLTLSAPKSVSILYALADPATRAAIAQVQMDASRAVVNMLNREAAFTRRGRNGVVIEKASLIVATFQHSEARPAPHWDNRIFADMNLHNHLCIANVAERPRHHPDDEPSFGALDGRAVYGHNMAAGSVYHLALASGLQRLGFDVEACAQANSQLAGFFNTICHQRSNEVAHDVERLSHLSKLQIRTVAFHLRTNLDWTFAERNHRPGI